ncbi:acyltransferase family protein [Streptomyces sp. NPDC050516]|uniref:acyltransferase family protein n=1 Tax=Streptomyces sp. NPDC050516 TaxID=3365621 RepID=UPI0037B0FD86
MTPGVSVAPPAAGQGVHSRLPSLTGMRFLAALLVFLFHSSRTDPPLSLFRGSTAHWYSTVFSQAGWVGVSFFFLLSGFVLTWVANPSDTPRLFWRRRIAKLYPNHVVMFAVTMALLTTAATWRQWLPNLFLVQTWFPTAHLDTVFSIDQPSWSLSCEIVFYLCFPLLYRRLVKIAPDRLWAWAGIVVAAVFAVAAVAQLALPSSPMTPSPGGPRFLASQWQVWVVYALPPVRLLEFVLGMLMARIVQSGRWIRLPLLPAGLLTIGAYAAASRASWSFAAVAVCLVPLALLIASAAVADLRGRRSPFRGPVALWLGEVSFAFYLVHGPVLGYLRGKIGFGVTFGPLAGSAVLLFALAVSVLLAWHLHTAVETPMMRRWSKPSTGARTPLAPGLLVGAPDALAFSGTPRNAAVPRTEG